MQFVDTHCHIHEASSLVPDDDLVQVKWANAGITKPDIMIEEAADAAVNKLLCVGCTLRDSRLASKLAAAQANCFAAIGIHPHEAKDHLSPHVYAQFAALAAEDKVVAIGECGLDYYYSHSPKHDQIKLLEFQLQLAVDRKLPVIFHVRDAFSDFLPIFDHFPGLKGVIHSFTGEMPMLKQLLSRGLYMGVNGIVTFTKDAGQLAAVKAVPLDRLLLETDAPFLTPAPFRGTICMPKHVVRTAEFLSDLRGEALEQIAEATTRNATEVFKI